MLQNRAGIVELSGPLVFSRVEPLLLEGYRLIADQGAEVFDLTQVEQTDSAGLALLVAWWRFAKKHSVALRFTHVPESLTALMAVTNIDGVLQECLD